MFFKKLKEENKSLEKKVASLKAELSEALVRETEMRKHLADKHARHTEDDVAQAIRNAIVRQCERFGQNAMAFRDGNIFPVEPQAVEILHLVAAYNKLNDVCAIDVEDLSKFEVMIRPQDAEVKHA